MTKWILFVNYVLMIQEEFFAKALDVFIRYGFRKTSMDDIAQAVGISRQAIYKRFGNKESLFKAVVDEAVDNSFREARAALEDTSLPIRERLLQSCNCSAGQFIEALRSSPHSFEVIAMANAEAAKQVEVLSEEFDEFAAGIMLAEGLFEQKQRARDAIFAIHAASKGLLHTAEDQEQYLDGIRTVIRAVVPPLEMHSKK